MSILSDRIIQLSQDLTLINIQ